MKAPRSVLALVVFAVIAAGCGGSSATASERIDACVEKQPDATKSQCEGWEKDGKLNDDGTHVDHKKMGG